MLRKHSIREKSWLTSLGNMGYHMVHCKGVARAIRLQRIVGFGSAFRATSALCGWRHSFQIYFLLA